MLEDVQTRLENRVPELANRVHDAADFTAFLNSNGKSIATPAAYVIPAALVGERPQDATGVFIQGYTESFSVVLVFRSTGAKADRALKKLQSFLFDVIKALVGWAPDGIIGVFQLARGRVAGATGGLLTYQIDFSIHNQLRVQP
jgi:hypothetical protein